jgi:hypothetical protein
MLERIYTVKTPDFGLFILGPSGLYQKSKPQIKRILIKVAAPVVFSLNHTVLM